MSKKYNKKYDIFSHFWDKKFGVNFTKLEEKIPVSEIVLRSKVIMLNKNKDKAKEKYKQWFTKENQILLDKKKNLLDKITNIDLKNLPKHAYLIEIDFKLKKPYISRDDEDFYIIDNPIVKDKVFKVPMVRPSTWKGALRFASEGINFEDKDKKDEIIERLFGNDKNDNENQKRGRLTFYPTFFDRISLEVITPLDRETKTPSLGPIYFETVPENAEGELRILYYPYDLIAVGEFGKIEKEVEEDFEFLGEGLRKMFYEVGFSAKKTSGFGVAEINEVKIIPNNELSKELNEIVMGKLNENYNGGGDGE